MYRVILACGVVALVLVAASPVVVFEGRCTGIGDTSGTQWVLNCLGDGCTDNSCSDGPHLNGDDEQYCGCSTASEPACCHLVLINANLQNQEWGANGDCTSCGSTGICTHQQGTGSNSDKHYSTCTPVAPQ